MLCKVVGVTFKNDDFKYNRQEIIAGLFGKEKIYLKREPLNKFDSNAVAVMLKRSKKDWKLGYIRSELAAFFADLWPTYKFFATIAEIKDGSIEDNISYGLVIDVKKILRGKLKTKRKKGI